MDRQHLLPDRNDGTADLGHHIVARYGRSPGVIPMEATLQNFRRTALFGHDRLPLLARLSRYWGGMNQPYPGSGGPLTFLQPSPFASVPVTGAERIGRSIEPVSTNTVIPGAQPSVAAVAHRPLPGARETVKRTSSSAAPAATKPGSIVMRRPKSRPEGPSPDTGDAPPARHPEATDTAMVAPVQKLADSITPSPLPLSPTDTGVGRPIIRRRKHPSPDAPARTTASVTTETEPPLRIGLRSREKESTIRRTELPLPAAGQPVPSARNWAPASPAFPARSQSARREEPSPIDTSAAITSQENPATTTIAKYSRPAPVLMALPRQGGPSRINRSEAAVGVFAEPRPRTSTRNAPATVADTFPPIAFPIPEPRAAAARSLAEQPTSAWGPAPRSRPAGQPATAMPGAEIGSTDALSRAHSPMPLVVQRQAPQVSAEPTQGERFPSTAWRTGDAGRSGSMTAVHIEDLHVGTEVGPNPPQTGHGERPNVDDLVDKVFRMLMHRLAVERERRGRQSWF